MAWSGFDRAVRRVPGGAAAVFRAIDVPLSVVDRPGRRAPFRSYVAYFEVAARLSEDPYFGLRFGSRTRAQRSGIPGYLVLNARRFRDAIQDLVRTLPTLVGGVHVQLVEDRDPPALLWSLADVGPASQFASHANAYFVRMLQAHRGRDWRPLRVLYAIAEPARGDLYRATLGCNVVFDAPVNALELSRDDLSAEKTDVDTHLHTLLSTYADFLLERQGTAPACLEEAVRTTIRDGLALGRTDLTFVARRLRLSRRNLQRALAEHGLSFSAVRDEERFVLAQHMLQHGNASIGAIAAHLGYAETAAFSRAYRHRFGLSPRAARQTARRGQRAIGPHQS